MTELKDIAVISGKGGLFKVVKPGRTGVILESMDQKKGKMVATPNHKVSVLSDISIYTNTEEGSIPLEDVLRKIYEEFGDDPGVDSKSSADELMSFLKYIIPEYDEGRVYPSDVKKLVNWYGIMLREEKEWFEVKQEEQNDAPDNETEPVKK
jgi:hypothetical protein